MKVRSGFVSNSSSSSFCVSRDAYKSVFDLAQAMIPCRGWDEDEEVVAKIEAAKGRMNNDHPISFRSCNYDTYIALIEEASVGEGYQVETCNNHNWKLENTSLHMDEGCYTFPHGTAFWSPEEDMVFMNRAGDELYEYCKTHYCQFVKPIVGGRELPLQCPRCYREKHPEVEDSGVSKLTNLFNELAKNVKPDADMWIASATKDKYLVDILGDTEMDPWSGRYIWRLKK